MLRKRYRALHAIYIRVPGEPGTRLYESDTIFEVIDTMTSKMFRTVHVPEQNSRDLERRSLCTGINPIDCFIASDLELVIDPHRGTVVSNVKHCQACRMHILNNISIVGFTDAFCGFIWGTPGTLQQLHNIAFGPFTVNILLIHPFHANNQLLQLFLTLF